MTDLPRSDGNGIAATRDSATRENGATGRDSAAQRGLQDVLRMASGRAATQGVLILSALVIPRTLGAAGYGQFLAAMAVLAILQEVSSFGLPLVEMRFLAPLYRGAENATQRHKATALGSAIWSLRVTLGWLAAVLAVFWFARSEQLRLAAWVVVALGVLAVLRFSYEATRSLFLPLGLIGHLVTFDFVRAVGTLVAVLCAFPFFGISGVFVTLVGLYALLFVACVAWLSKRAPMARPTVRWSPLAPYLSYGAWSFVGTLSEMVQNQFSVYALAAWGSLEQAGYLGLSIQVFGLFRLLVLSARNSLMPILAELEENGEVARVRQWGGLMLRVSAALSCLAVVSWALVGEVVVQGLLKDSFLPVYPLIAIILLGALFYAGGTVLSGLLYIYRRQTSASLVSVVYALATIGGLVIAFRGPASEVAQQIAWAYAVAAVIFFVLNYLALGIRCRLWLPFRRFFFLTLPALAVWPALTWQGTVGERFAALALFLALYCLVAVVGKLLPLEELRRIFHLVRRRNPG
ncbi:MAG: lipopolysaccharide biosynthesis protein [Deltaproteobacteria bacterium]|nr:lipopolysaccharide biosynthesis protein [Deltaproteobacteria bacterium]